MLQWGRTALLDASQEGRTDVVELLLSNGADVNATTEVSHLHIHVHTLQVLCCGYSDM